ncbi:BZ3500_MvSof-1268-A1-R1_Chr4-2g06930 [Microbotryum saponariae]|uniref:BZ3500_MvSof-1268-A1-R1_Chr4-2g06930 protein n=1 Tax=Microbotryum saponariae TaxID=289078 RepID=A0A2X0MBL0_9BASI|nr:BZ3500_MvSof-1268-A1-R1_Chr4-2g06930 [Microbotryum saponariae]SDA06595.1 BZ3501_MvSof-1269-A2-R1_Chr4-2g06641 [Microbotryum saponariae]
MGRQLCGCVHFWVSWKTWRLRKASSTAAADPRRTCPRSPSLTGREGKNRGLPRSSAEHCSPRAWQGVAAGSVLPPRLAAADRAFQRHTHLLSYLPISHPASVTDPHTPPIKVLSRTPQLGWTGAWQKTLPDTRLDAPGRQAAAQPQVSLAVNCSVGPAVLSLRPSKERQVTRA